MVYDIACKLVMSLDNPMSSTFHYVMTITLSELDYKHTRPSMVSAAKLGMSTHKNHGDDFILWL